LERGRNKRGDWRPLSVRTPVQGVGEKITG
jgi:hypothetical protein